MSSIVTLGTPGSAFDSTIVGENLDILAPQGQENIIKVEGDSPITIVGGALNDTITAGAGDANILAGKGDDLIEGGIGDDTLQGGDGKDTINGGIGADLILGGAGNDLIRGGLPGMGADGEPMGDTLQGGAGEDIFEFVKSEFDSGAVDEILDFQADGFADLIRIVGVGDGNVSYNPETGIISIDGQEAIDVGTDLDLDISRKEGTDTWELF